MALVEELALHVLTLGLVAVLADTGAGESRGAGSAQGAAVHALVVDALRRLVDHEPLASRGAFCNATNGKDGLAGEERGRKGRRASGGKDERGRERG